MAIFNSYVSHYQRVHALAPSSYFCWAADVLHGVVANGFPADLIGSGEKKVVQVQVLHRGSGCSDVVVAIISPRQKMNLMGYHKDIIGNWMDL